MDDERLPKRLFYGDVATGSRRQGGQIRRYKDTLKSSLKGLQINPTNWEEIANDRPTWRWAVKTGAAIYEANRIAAAKVKREARKSQVRPVRNAAAQPAAVSHFTNPDTTTDTTPTASDSSDEDQEYTCPHYDRTFTSRIGLVGHLRIHRTDTGESVPGAPTYTHNSRLTCPHCPRTFNHRMSLFGHMRIHKCVIGRNPDTPTASNTSMATRSTLAPSSGAPIIATTPTTTDSAVDDTATDDFSCPHCPRIFTSRIGLVGHLRIHRTDTGEPVPGAPTYSHQARLNHLAVSAASYVWMRVGAVPPVMAKFFFGCSSTKGQPVDALGAQIRQRVLQAKQRLRQEQAAKGQACYGESKRRRATAYKGLNRGPSRRQNAKNGIATTNGVKTTANDRQFSYDLLTPTSPTDCSARSSFSGTPNQPIQPSGLGGSERANSDIRRISSVKGLDDVLQELRDANTSVTVAVQASKP
nr:unnamed protein product [Spirometra erinaceieuropaei]